MKNTIVLGIVIIILASCSGKKTGEVTPGERIHVKAAIVESVKSTGNLQYSGTVEASLIVPLTFQTNGTVEKVYAEVGDAVKKGQLLAKVDPSDMQSIYNTMLAKYQQAKDAYDRLKIVYDKGSLPEIKWVEMVSNFEQAKSALELAKNNLEKCNLLAPVDGIIGRRNIEPGQFSLGTILVPLEIVRIETVFVKISVPENEISRIQKGQKSSISVPALDGKEYEGMVTNVSPVADAISRTYTVKISVKNTSLALKPGMVCDVKLNLSTETFSLTVPYKAVSKDSEGKTFVYVVSPDHGSVHKQLIVTGKYNEAGIEVISGLEKGQSVVSEGCDKLSDNSLISL
ncbi:MAG: efflux RND transporter periplasmic adaptor subunit [Bacteroidetes bacterium]|nr:efflux RND transporter periplasmic adaptor subunit [Bacteroidota bacterium]